MKREVLEFFENLDFSRRAFLKGAGAFLLGTMAGKIITVSEVEAKATSKKLPTNKWPWPYKKLDPAKTAELAYQEWYRIYCGGAVIYSIFKQLAELVGEPYKSFPVDAFIYLEGGTASWGTICGSLAGANLVTNLIIGPRPPISDSELGHLMGSEIIEWYCNAELPIYVPKNPKVSPEKIPHTVSNSPLCHVSVGKWMQAANKGYRSPERRDRCARVAASVAYHLVTLLNAWKDGKYEPKGDWTPVSDFGITAQMNCNECHGTNIPTAPKS